jgi:hypothetical protein
MNNLIREQIAEAAGTNKPCANFCDLTAKQKNNIIAAIITSSDVSTILVDALIRSDLLSSLLVSDAIDDQSKWAMIANETRDEISHHAQYVIDEYNAGLGNVVQLQGRPQPEVRMQRCVNYEINGESHSIVFDSDYKPEITILQDGEPQAIEGSALEGRLVILNEKIMRPEGDCFVLDFERDPYDPCETFEPEPKPFDAMADAACKPSDFA